MAGERASFRLTIAELTMKDGRTTGHASMSVTEGGRTATLERQIDTGPVVRLSEAQWRVLGLLCRRNAEHDGSLSTPEISRILQRGGFDDWARGKLLALEKRGLVVRLGTSFSGGQCWGPTEDGCRALAHHKGTGGRDEG